MCRLAPLDGSNGPAAVLYGPAAVFFGSADVPAVAGGDRWKMDHLCAAVLGC